MVVGDKLNREDVYQAADRAQARLGLPVKPVIRTHTRWEDPSDRLAVQLRTQALVDVTADRTDV